jgi:hypothetical protein
VTIRSHPAQIAGRYSALERYCKSQESFKEELEMISNVIGAGLRGATVPPNALHAVPDALKAAMEDLLDAVTRATAVAVA